MNFDIAKTSQKIIVKYNTREYNGFDQNTEQLLYIYVHMLHGNILFFIIIIIKTYYKLDT